MIWQYDVIINHGNNSSYTDGGLVEQPIGCDFDPSLLINHPRLHLVNGFICALILTLYMVITLYCVSKLIHIANSQEGNSASAQFQLASLLICILGVHGWPCNYALSYMLKKSLSNEYEFFCRISTFVNNLATDYGVLIAVTSFVVKNLKFSNKRWHSRHVTVTNCQVFLIVTFVAYALFSSGAIFKSVVVVTTFKGKHGQNSDQDHSDGPHNNNNTIIIIHHKCYHTSLNASQNLFWLVYQTIRLCFIVVVPLVLLFLSIARVIYYISKPMTTTGLLQRRYLILLAFCRSVITVFYCILALTIELVPFTMLPLLLRSNYCSTVQLLLRLLNEIIFIVLTFVVACCNNDRQGAFGRIFLDYLTKYKRPLH